MGAPPLRSASCVATVILVLWCAPLTHAHSPVVASFKRPFASFAAPESIVLRGHSLQLHVYPASGHDPVLIASGDGGWINLAPHVAELLASAGYPVVGLDSRAYLSSFTSRGSTLRTDNVIDDFLTLLMRTSREGHEKPLLIGVSEGAGLSVLAATDERVKSRVSGVIGLGLGDVNELGWRWSDSMIYLTHGIPNEPTFSTQAIVQRLAPLPLVAIHSTHDEYVPADEISRIVHAATGPSRLWFVNASNHRFGGNLSEFDRRLLEGIEWIRTVPTQP